MGQNDHAHGGLSHQLCIEIIPNILAIPYDWLKSRYRCLIFVNGSAFLNAAYIVSKKRLIIILFSLPYCDKFPKWICHG